MASFVPGSIQDLPDNIAIKSGEDANFYFVNPVAAMYFVTWEEYASTNAGESVANNGTISYGGDASIGARFSLTMTSNGTDVISQLVLSNVVAADAGKYKASEVIANYNRYAYLILLGEYISCTW